MSAHQSPAVPRPRLTLSRPPTRPPGPEPAHTDAKNRAKERQEAEAKARKQAELAEAKARKAAAGMAKAERENRRAHNAAKQLRQRQQNAVLAQMQAASPDLFDTARPKPLAKGIAADIRQTYSVSWRVLTGLMAWWTKRSVYQEALAAGGPRYALDGSERGEVTAEEQAVAQAQLDALRIRRPPGGRDLGPSTAMQAKLTPT